MVCFSAVLGGDHAVAGPILSCFWQSICMELCLFRETPYALKIRQEKYLQKRDFKKSSFKKK